MQKHATVRPSVVELLLEISRYCDLYLMETVLDDKSEVLIPLFTLTFFFCCSFVMKMCYMMVLEFE